MVFAPRLQRELRSRSRHCQCETVIAQLLSHESRLSQKTSRTLDPPWIDVRDMTTWRPRHHHPHHPMRQQEKMRMLICPWQWQRPSFWIISRRMRMRLSKRPVSLEIRMVTWRGKVTRPSTTSTAAAVNASGQWKYDCHHCRTRGLCGHLCSIVALRNVLNLSSDSWGNGYSLRITRVCFAMSILYLLRAWMRVWVTYGGYVRLHYNRFRLLTAVTVFQDWRWVGSELQRHAGIRMSWQHGLDPPLEAQVCPNMALLVENSDRVQSLGYLWYGDENDFSRHPLELQTWPLYLRWKRLY